jgi:hypothetical protein
MDFTIAKYKKLLGALKEAGYTFQTFACFLENPRPRAIVLRHDVDAKKNNSLRFARIQAGMEIKGTYYFRMVPWSYDRDVIREIAARGHEIGYHYETMDSAKGEMEKAYTEFCRNLEKIRETVAVKTICMHGSPLSKYDNRSLWDKYDYKELGIIGEPYFDIDFSKVLYLTDTGRRWDGEKVSIRDKVKTEDHGPKTEEQTMPTHHIPHTTYHSTNDIINAAKSGELPDQIMFTFHPQRWTDKPLPWIKELIWQNVKNQVKRFLVK